MKTFKDLEFKQHIHRPDFYWAARISFDNGYGVSVITGISAYASLDYPYEVAVLYKNNLCYETPITDDVIGYCNEEKVTEIMIKVQRLTA